MVRLRRFRALSQRNWHVGFHFALVAADFIKDDELQANGLSCLLKIALEVMLVNKAADKMHKVMVFNPAVKSMKCAGGMTLCTSKVELV